MKPERTLLLTGRDVAALLTGCLQACFSLFVEEKVSGNQSSVMLLMLDKAHR